MQSDQPASDSVSRSVLLNLPRRQVWCCLTEPDKLTRWWGEGVRLEPRVGGRFEEAWQDESGNDCLTTGHVTYLEWPAQLHLSWREQAWNCDTRVVFELSREDERTRLTVNHDGWQQLPQDDRVRLHEEFDEGWKELLDKLAALVATEPELLPPIEQRTYVEASVERVYQMLTTAAGWDAWFTHGTSLEAKPGGEIRLRWKDFGAGRWNTEDGGAVWAAEPDRRFVFQWHPCSTSTTVEFVLTAAGSGTQILVKESGYPRTDEDLKAMLDCATGWGEALTLLKFYLEHGVTYGEVPAGAEVDYQF